MNNNIGMVLMANALGPVVRKDHFSRQRKPRDESKRKGILFARALDKDVGNERFHLFDENEVRTIDLFA